MPLLTLLMPLLFSPFIDIDAIADAITLADIIDIFADIAR
jgi:hypothetical protein